MKKLLSALAILVLPISAQAIPIMVDFTWTGNDGYSMTGSFTGEDLDSDLFIRDTEVTSLIMVGRRSGRLFGFTTEAHTLPFFNFNFNLQTNAFPRFPQQADSDTGQCWNLCGTTILGPGFAIGANETGIGANGTLILSSKVGTGDGRRPMITQITQIPPPVTQVAEPAPFALLSAGVIAFGIARRKKRKLVA